MLFCFECGFVSPHLHPLSGFWDQQLVSALCQVTMAIRSIIVNVAWKAQSNCTKACYTRCKCISHACIELRTQAPWHVSLRLWQTVYGELADEAVANGVAERWHLGRHLLPAA